MPADKSLNKRRKLSRHPVIRFLEYRILHIEDSPRKIALGAAIGIFIVPSPLLGLHIVMIILLCFMLKANKLAALTSTCLNNIFTVVPIYYSSYLIGRVVCEWFIDTKTLSRTQIAQIFAPHNFIRGFYHLGYWEHLWSFLKSVGPELWVGSFIIGGLGAVVSYFIFYNMVMYYRSKSPHRRYTESR